MKKILYILLLSLSINSYAFACYDEKATDKENFHNCEKQAKKGDAWDQTFLGIAYYQGQGTIQDYKEAIKWYTKAAEQGNGLAQFNLGLMYAQGKGTIQDYKEALKWYTKAAEQGNTLAQRNLGLMYATGKGATQDYVLAHMYNNISAANGDKKAIKIRDLLSKQMTSSQIEEAQRLAREWMDSH